jgi:hypothetical protein
MFKHYQQGKYTMLKHTDMFPSAKTLKAIRYTIKTKDKIYSFKTLKQARQFAQYLQGMTIITQVKG